MSGMEGGAVGVVGLGIMGLAYARNLRAAGFAVVGFDVAADRSRLLEDLGGEPAASPAEVARRADRVLLALPSATALRDVCLGPDGLVSALGAGAAVAEMSTLPPDDKEVCRAALAERGAILLDCPVSGTGAQAATGDLVVYASGEAAAVARLAAVFAAIARETRHVGDFGAGMKLKYVANLLVTIHNLAAAEALLLARRAGLDLAMVYDAIRSGAGTSRMFEVRGPLMIEGRYEPPTMRFEVYKKDLDLILGFAHAVGCPVPLMAASVPFYDRALAEGRGGEDTAALFAVLEGMGEGER